MSASIEYTYRIPVSAFSICNVYQQNLNCSKQLTPCFQKRGVLGHFIEINGELRGITIAHLFSNKPETYCLLDSMLKPLVFF